MPETLAAWIAANTLTTASVLTYNQILVLSYVAVAAATAGVGDYQKRKARSKARDALNSSLEDRLVMVSTAQAGRSRVYGRARNVDGVVFKHTHGNDKEFYTLVVALAGHEVDAIEDVYFNEQLVALDGSGYVQTAPYLLPRLTSASEPIVFTAGAGSVVLSQTPVSGSVRATIRLSGDNGDQVLEPVSVVGNTVSFSGAGADGGGVVTYQWSDPVSVARVRKYTGAPGQDLYAVLEPLVGSAVEVSDEFQGMACLVVTLQYNQDAFPTGVPQISAVMRGAKVYDPRTATTAWSQNPAIIARDWSLHEYGGGCDGSEINEAAIAAAANACDTSTVFTTTSGTQTRSLYECGIVLPLEGNPDDGLSEICEAMAGQWGWAGGRLSLRAGTYRAPVATITEDWVTGAEDIQIVSTTATADAVNVMRPTLSDAAQGYVASPAAEVRAASYVALDGRELAQELQLGGVTHAVHAQHVCGVLMRESRESLTLTLPCNLRAYELELFDVVTVVLSRFGWGAGKLFEVVGWRFTMTGGVLLTLRETAAGIYTPDTSFDVLNISPNTGLPRPELVAAMGSLTATSNTVAQQDGSSLARVSLAWPASTSQAVLQSGRAEVQYAEAVAALPAGDWTAAPPASGRATQADIYGLRIGVAYLFRGRFVNTLGMAGPWRQTIHVVEGRRAPRIYREATAPSDGVQDGDEWFDTDDGNKHHVRESGAWVAVRVGTGGIEPGAATEISELSALAIAVTAGGTTSSSYTNVANWTPVGTIAFTAGLTGNVLLNVSASFSFSGAPGLGVGELWCSATLAADFDNDTNEDAGDTLIEDFVRVPQTGTGTVRTAYVSAQFSRAVTAGVAYTWPIYAQKLEGTCALNNFYARVEQIKR